MIITVSDLKKQIDCGTATDELIIAKLDAIEAVIRAYTNNNFQLRGIRAVCSVSNGNLYGVTTGLSVGDTIQVTESAYNGGLYVITDIDHDAQCITIDGELTDESPVLVTKIGYPADVVQCAVDLYKWKQMMGEKVGIKSETISRHSVTYEDSATLFMGYPVGILNGLKLHKKARC